MEKIPTIKTAGLRVTVGCWMIISVMFIGEIWRLWDWGWLPVHVSSWVHINPKDADHPNGIYCYSTIWNVSKFVCNECCWFLYAIASMLLGYKNKWSYLATREFVAYRGYDVILWLYNYKAEFYATNFLFITLINIIFWYFERVKKPAPIC